MNGTPDAASARAGFWRRRWRGQLGWHPLFWRDMLTVGSLINLGTGFAALLLIAQGQPIGWALAVHFSPLPYNLFLLASLWRHPQAPGWTRPAGCAWLVAMLVV